MQVITLSIVAFHECLIQLNASLLVASVYYQVKYMDVYFLNPSLIRIRTFVKSLLAHICSSIGSYLLGLVAITLLM